MEPIQSEVNSLELAQKFALRMCANLGILAIKNYFGCSPYQISSNAGFTWICAQCLLNGSFYFPNEVFVHQTSSIVTRLSINLSNPYLSIFGYMVRNNSFEPRTIRSWNFLPTSVTTVGDLIMRPFYNFASKCKISNR